MDVSTYRQRKQLGHDAPFEIWLNRLITLGVISWEDWEQENGKFFGYPDCCIKWFLFMSKMNIKRIAETTNYLYGEANCGYVKCPKCIKKEISNAKLRQITRTRGRTR